MKLAILCAAAWIAASTPVLADADDFFGLSIRQGVDPWPDVFKADAVGDADAFERDWYSSKGDLPRRSYVLERPVTVCSERPKLHWHGPDIRLLPGAHHARDLPPGPRAAWAIPGIMEVRGLPKFSIDGGHARIINGETLDGSPILINVGPDACGRPVA